MKTVLTKDQIKHKILRLSFEIIENNLKEKELDLIGLGQLLLQEIHTITELIQMLYCI